MADPTDIDFEQPPLIETVIGVQFDAIQSLSAAHFGWFWKQHLGEGWPVSTTQPTLQDQFETFDNSRFAGLPNFQLVFGADVGRAQFWNRSKDRLVQFQRTRLLLNWQNQAGEYPRYDALVKEFESLLSQLTQFVGEAALGSIVLNQWEMTYVNQIPRGQLWQTPADWPGVLPGLLAPSRMTCARFESIAGEWHHEIPEQRGRVHIALQHGKALAQQDVLFLQITARGPIPDEGLRAGLDLGHHVIVKSFADITSESAHKSWKRRS